MITTIQFKTLDDLYKFYNDAIFNSELLECMYCEYFVSRRGVRLFHRQPLAPIHLSILGDNRKEPVFFCCTPECGWTIEYRHFKILPMTSALSRVWYMAFIASVSFMFFSASI